MAYSTITKKKCKCGCNKYPTLGYGGYSYSCAPIEIKEKVGSRKDLLRKNKNTRNAIKVKMRGEIVKKDEVTGETYKEAWFKARRREMTGICKCGCGNPSSKNDDANFRSSACHILPQKNFPSVQFHPLNFIEMAFWGGCHTNFDGMGSDRWDKLECWDEIVRRFLILLPLTFPNERKHIPKILQQFIDECTPIAELTKVNTV